jgi:hypothetical protein
VLFLASLTFSAALAQEVEILPCPDGEVSGIIVAYDEETGIVTLQVESGLCTVSLTDDYDHPIIDLLGAYFGEINPEEIAAALESLQVCLVSDGEITAVSQPLEDGTCAEGELVTITGVGETGGFEAQTESGETVSFDLADEETAGTLAAALDSLQADWTIEEGGVDDVGNDIGEYHDEGIGFGVLVKVYAIFEEAQQACLEAGDTIPVEEGETDVETESDEVDPCDVTVELLLEELENMGMGQLFQVYGKPAIMGIGHVRNIGEGDGTTGTGDSTFGICNARSHGGNANATGQPDIVCDDTDGDSSSDSGDPEVIEGDQ